MGSFLYPYRRLLSREPWPSGLYWLPDVRLKLLSAPDDNLLRDEDLLMGWWSFISRQLGAPRGDMAGVSSWHDLLQRLVLLGEAGILKLVYGDEDGDGITWTMGMPSSSLPKWFRDSGWEGEGIVLELKSSVRRNTDKRDQCEFLNIMSDIIINITTCILVSILVCGEITSNYNNVTALKYIKLFLNYLEWLSCPTLKSALHRNSVISWSTVRYLVGGLPLAV